MFEIALGGRFSVMECSLQESPFLLVVLASGALKIWHVLSRKQVLSDTIETITNVRETQTPCLGLCASSLTRVVMVLFRVDRVIPWSKCIA